MDDDWSMADAASHSSVASAVASIHRPSYVESPQLIDVMFDQLEYLVAHKSSKCSPGCSDCQRLEQVKNWLLAPFRSALEHGTGQESGRQ